MFLLILYFFIGVKSVPIYQINFADHPSFLKSVPETCIGTVKINFKCNSKLNQNLFKSTNFKLYV